jgi:hypothetical protein
VTAPIEPKVQAAGVIAAVSGAALWLLQHYVFKGTVPDGVVSMVYFVVPGVLAVAAGWLAPHQSRTPVPVPMLSPPLTVAAAEAYYGALGKAAEPPSNVTVTHSPPLTEEQAQAFKDALTNALPPSNVTVQPPAPPAAPAGQP